MKQPSTLTELSRRRMESDDFLTLSRYVLDIVAKAIKGLAELEPVVLLAQAKAPPKPLEVYVLAMNDALRQSLGANVAKLLNLRPEYDLACLVAEGTPIHPVNPALPTVRDIDFVEEDMRIIVLTMYSRETQVFQTCRLNVCTGEMYVGDLIAITGAHNPGEFLSKEPPTMH